MTTAGHGPRFLSRGEQAMRAVAKVLPEAQTVRVQTNLGPAELKPGTILNGKKLIVLPSSMSVVYLVGDELYEWDPGNFMRDVYLDAMSEGAKRAMGMVYLAKAEMALLSGIFVPWYLLLGVSAVKLGFFYSREKRTVDDALKQAPNVLRQLQEIRRAYPTLFNKMASSAAREILVNLPSGVTSEDVAFFLGRVLKGVGGLPDVTLGAVAKVAAKVAAIVTATHLPAVTAHAMQNVAATQGRVLQHRLAEAGIVVTEKDASRIMNEINANRKTLPKLQELETSSQQLIPVLNRLQTLIRME